MSTTPAPEKPTMGDVTGPIRPVLVMLAVMWGLEIVDVPLDGRLDQHGIEPRELSGLDGVLWAPFLHGGFGHLIANTLPFLIMGAVIALSGFRVFAQVTVIVGLISGLGVWLFGPDNTVHIGASGLVFGYLLYLLVRGFFARKVSYVLGGIVIFMIYGGVLWGLLPAPGVSWQGHLFGAIGGVAAASLVHGKADTPGTNAATAGS